MGPRVIDILFYVLLHFSVGVRYCMCEPYCVLRVLKSIVKGESVVILSAFPTTIIVLQESIVVHILGELSILNFGSDDFVLEVLDVFTGSLPPVLVRERVLAFLNFVWVALLVLF